MSQKVKLREWVEKELQGYILTRYMMENIEAVMEEYDVEPQKAVSMILETGLDELIEDHERADI